MAKRWIGLRSAVSISALLVALPVAGQGPLDLLNGTARNVQVQIEASGDPAIVGQDFGPAIQAVYSASGNIGTLTISAEAHEQIYANAFPPPVPGSFTDIIIEFDLTTFEATSQPASGAFAGGQLSSSFTQNALSTAAPAGFLGPNLPSLFCTSQMQVDTLCMSVPIVCGEICTTVAGSQYDPGTGLVNLVGSQAESGCDGGICTGPVDRFCSRGDLMLSEAPPDDDDDSNSPCFIATAAYGTPLADQLDGLRAFRDSRLLRNAIGAALTDAYYRLSPPLADRIAGNRGLLNLARYLLDPVVRIMETPKNPAQSQSSVGLP